MSLVRGCFTVGATLSLVADLENSIERRSPDQRVGTLWRVADLFIQHAQRLNEQQVDVFDDVLQHLVGRVDVVQHLARCDDIAVAEPVLVHCARLGPADLVEISNTKSQAHLLAMSGRTDLDHLVTDVLMRRGNRNVVHRLADNQEALFSESGYNTLVKYSGSDRELAEKVRARADLPVTQRQHLLLRGQTLFVLGRSVGPFRTAANGSSALLRRPLSRLSRQLTLLEAITLKRSDWCWQCTAKIN